MPSAQKSPATDEMSKVKHPGVSVRVGRASFGALQGELAAGTRANSLLFRVCEFEGTFAYSARLSFVCTTGSCDPLHRITISHPNRASFPCFSPHPHIHLRPKSDRTEKSPCCGGDNGAMASL